MNALERPVPGFLGSAAAIEALAASEGARVLALSDTHGHYSVVEAIVRDFGPECDALAFAGDGMWDIVQYLERAYESDRLASALPPVLAFVSGNGDGEEYRVGLPEGGDVAKTCPGFAFSVPDRLILSAAGFRLFLAHGHRHSVDVSPEILVNVAHSLDCDIAVFGHTHMPFQETYSRVLALNPGSPARPRGGSESSFAIIELDSTSITPRVRFVTVREGTRGTFAFSES